MIFGHLELYEIITSLRPICRRFKEIVDSSGALWKNFSFPHMISFNGYNLLHIMRFCVHFVDFQVPYAHFDVNEVEINAIFNRLSLCQNLKYLDLTACAKLSQLAFLQSVGHNLDVLMLSECENINENEFSNLFYCSSLKALHVAFTKITPDIILNTVMQNECLEIIDAAGIYFQFQCLRQILNSHKNAFIMVSLHEDVTPDEKRHLNRMYSSLHIYGTF